MKKVLCLLSLLSLTACGMSSVGHPNIASSLYKAGPFTRQKEVVFTPPDWPCEEVADLYVPQGEGPWPAVVLVHGGSWKKPSRRHEMEHIARALVRRGYVAMNITYRLAPDHRYPKAIEDVREAHRWLRRNASSLGVCADEIAVFGFSAGGHLAALVGGMDAKPPDRFQAVVAGAAPTDLRNFKGEGRVALFLGGNGDDMPDTYAEASPIVHVSPDDPPVFLYHGAEDQLVRPRQAINYHAALQKAGVPAELRLLPGRGHVGSFIADDTAIEAAIDFLDRHVKRS